MCLPLFLRDELANWTLNSAGESSTSNYLESDAVLFNGLTGYDSEFCVTRIKPNIELLNKRILTLACAKELEANMQQPGAERAPAINQSILDLVSCATNIQKLSLMDPCWQPWF